MSIGAIVFAVVAPGMAAVVAAGTPPDTFGPPGALPCTNKRNVFTPAVAEPVANPLAGSANPSGTGIVPTPPRLDGLPGAAAVHRSKPPPQSAKLMIIDGSPGVVPPANADGALNAPCRSAAMPVAPCEAATAAHSTLQGPASIATMLP